MVLATNRVIGADAPPLEPSSPSARGAPVPLLSSPLPVTSLALAPAQVLPTVGSVGKPKAQGGLAAAVRWFADQHGLVLASHHARPSTCRIGDIVAFCSMSSVVVNNGGASPPPTRRTPGPVGAPTAPGLITASADHRAR